jgi:hypothetical protein
MVRFTGSRSIKKLWIFCEGSKTEKNYFQKLYATERLSRLHVKVNDCSVTDAMGIVNYAIVYKRTHKRDFEKQDSIVCVFDRDANTNQQLEQCVSIANKNNIMLIFSNPFFEYWFLCHYGYFPSHYENADLIAKLKYYLPDYKKNDPELYIKTRDKIDIAIKNAKRIKNEHDDKGTVLISRENNPLSLVFELIEFMKSFK